MNLQINVLSSLACRSRISNIKQTWGQYFKDVLFYADFDESLDIKKYTNKPTSIGNEEKFLNRFKDIKQNNIFEWYFFVDDDTFINAFNLFNFLKTANPFKVYGRKINNQYGTYPQGGAGILISKQIIETIKTDSLYLRGSSYSDVLFGQILNTNNIELINVETFYEQTPHERPLTEEQINNMITFHYVADIMIHLYDKLYKK